MDNFEKRIGMASRVNHLFLIDTLWIRLVAFDHAATIAMAKFYETKNQHVLVPFDNAMFQKNNAKGAN